MKITLQFPFVSFIILLVQDLQIIASLSQEETYMIFPVMQGTCRVSKCGHEFCGETGTCINETSAFDSGKCYCHEGYTSPLEDSYYKCCYEQKSSKTAMFLEMFLLMGVGHYYAERLTYFKIKFSVYMTFVLILVIMLIVRCLKLRRKKYAPLPFLYKQFQTVSILTIGSVFIIWQIADVLMFGMKWYVDGHGIELY